MNHPSLIRLVILVIVICLCFGWFVSWAISRVAEESRVPVTVVTGE